MYNRIFDIDSRLDEGMFLFGARQVGKSTLLKEKFKDAVYFDLLDSDLRKRLQRKPELFKEALDKYPEKTLVIVDEIQKVPDLLDTVHSLMVEKGFHTERFKCQKTEAQRLQHFGWQSLSNISFSICERRDSRLRSSTGHQLRNVAPTLSGKESAPSPVCLY